jgi:hypothetical protein
MRASEYAAILRTLGYRTRVKLVTHASLANQSDRRMRAIQIIPTGWNDITAGGFFGPWLSCCGAGNHGWFCNRSLDREMARAGALDATRPQDGARAWARIDHEISDRAALVPLVNLREVEFVSARLHGYQHHPYLGLIADQAWLG